MKKKLTIILGLFLMASLVVAGLGISKEVSINSTYKDKIEAINNEDIERGDITCDNLGKVLTGSETCSQKMWKGDYRLGEVSISAVKCKTYNEKVINDETGEIDGSCILYQALKDDKIIEEITKQQEKKLEEIAKTIIKRERIVSKKNINDAGIITLTAKQ